MEHGDVKLADFGLAAVISDPAYFAGGGGGAGSGGGGDDDDDDAAGPADAGGAAAARKAYRGVRDAFWGTPLTMAPEVICGATPRRAAA